MNVAVARPITAQEVSARPIRNLSTVAVTRLPQQSVAGTGTTAPSPSPQATTPDDEIYILGAWLPIIPFKTFLDSHLMA